MDRLKVGPDLVGRVTDSVETAYLEGGGSAFAMEVGGASHAPPVVHRFSERFECRRCGIAYEVPQPRLFSFNSPFGACPTCHGFGNVIELDLNLAVPDQSKSIQQNAIEPFTKPAYRSHLVDLKRAARARGVRLTTPWRDLRDEERQFVVEGDESTVEQVTKNLHKLVDVIKVSDVSIQNCVSRELALVRVRANVQTRSEIMQIVDIFRANIVDVAPDSLMIEVTGDEDKVDSLQNLLRSFGVLEVMRTGTIAMDRGLSDEQTDKDNSGSTHRMESGL